MSMDRSPVRAVQAPEPTDYDIPAELSCSLCLDLLHDAVATPCNHTFCRACILRVCMASSTCPLCRAPLVGFDPAAAAVNSSIADLISAAVPRTIVARRAREAPRQVRHVRIRVGNHWAEVPSRVSSNNTNRWTMYVKTEGGLSSRLIDKVVYKLHPTFKPSEVTVRTPEFELTRLGWGYFTVECQIHWKSSLGMPPTEVDHELVFQEGGGYTETSATFEVLAVSGNSPAAPRRNASSTPRRALRRS
eukprot:TRINITY_DN52909_c0_g1_i1.p1 TRINITY_DN52909_c0_g1~~TRINITY_DN52909_c0_g1_i1.p1  ORF type:complete len:247 (+),score=24.25 TRINITY_DN52909_c0_g1_i1:92-832(+)